MHFSTLIPTQEEHIAGVKHIIDEASLFENPDEVHEQQELRKKVLMDLSKTTEHDM